MAGLRELWAPLAEKEARIYGRGVSNAVDRRAEAGRTPSFSPARGCFGWARTAKRRSTWSWLPMGIDKHPRLNGCFWMLSWRCGSQHFAYHVERGILHSVSEGNRDGSGGVSICLGALLCLLCTVMPSLVALAFSVASSALLFRVPVASVVGKAPCSSRADRCDHRFSLARLLLGLAVYGASFELPPAFLDEGTSLVYGGSMPSSSFLFTAATGLCVGETLLDAVI